MAEVPEVDYTAEEEAAMGGETQPEGETPSVKTPEGVEADPTEVRTSAKPLEVVKQESRDNQAVITPGKKAQEEVGTSKGASSSGQENPGQTGVEPEQGEYWQYSQEEWEQWEKEKQAYRRTHRQWRKSDEDLYAQRRRPGKREREALKRKAEPSSQWRPVKLVEAQPSRLPPPPPQSPRAKTSEEVQPNEAKLDDGQEKEDENKASQKVAKREKEVETSASYYSSDDEKSEEEEEVVLKGKANSPAKTFLGEMPALLTLDSSKEKERIPLLSKGSYRAVFAHPVNEGLVWKVGDHSEEAAWLRLYGSYVMPKLFRKIPVRVKLANSKFPEAGKNLRILEVEKVEMLGEIQKPRLLAMFIILVYMRGQGAALKDVGQSNWGIRRSIGGQPELVLLDAGSWTAVDPGPLKSLAEVSGYRDLLNKHQEVKAAITRFLAQSKAKVSSLMAFGVEALLDQGEVGVSLWRSLIRQRVVVTAPTRDNFVLLPRVSAIQKTEDWRIEILKEEAKE